MEEQSKSAWKLYAWIISTVLVIAAFFFIVHQARKPSTLPIKRVQVLGVSSQYQNQIEQTVKPYLNKGFLTIHLKQIQQALEQFDWIATAQVQRIWPNQLLIIVQPQKLVAFWNGDKVLNNYAESFPLGELTAGNNLPQLAGPSGDRLKVLSMLQQGDAILEALSLYITQLHPNLDNDWQMTLNNGMNLQIGEHQPLTRLQRFVTVYPKVFATSKKAAKNIDLRYPNGMAVRWGKLNGKKTTGT